MNATTLDPVTTHAQRAAMVSSQLRPNAVDDTRVVAAMALVPREQFLPASVRSRAYLDRAVPLGGGRYLNTPLATGRLLSEAYLRPSDRVLLIGAAGGYAAAVLSELVADVVAVEEAPALIALAREALNGTPRVRLVEAPLTEGCPHGGPFDVLMVDGAVEELPEALVAQVTDGGRIVTGLVDRGVTRLAGGRRTARGAALLPFLDADCVALPGFARPRGFTF